MKHIIGNVLTEHEKDKGSQRVETSDSNEFNSEGYEKDCVSFWSYVNIFLINFTHLILPFNNFTNRFMIS